MPEGRSAYKTQFCVRGSRTDVGVVKDWLTCPQRPEKDTMDRAVKAKYHAGSRGRHMLGS